MYMTSNSRRRLTREQVAYIGVETAQEAAAAGTVLIQSAQTQKELSDPKGRVGKDHETVSSSG